MHSTLFMYDQYIVQINQQLLYKTFNRQTWHCWRIWTILEKYVAYWNLRSSAIIKSEEVLNESCAQVKLWRSPESLTMISESLVQFRIKAKCRRSKV